MADKKKGKVIGVGGVFFKSKDPVALREWYKTHLGLPTDQYGALLAAKDEPKPEKGMLQWSPFAQDTDYFQPSEKEFMINFRVIHLEELAEELREKGVRICDSIEEFSYGKFLHILDPEDNKIELWEPTDDAFEGGEE